MPNSVVPLDKAQHKDLRLKFDRTFANAKNSNFVTLQAQEFFIAAAHYPIVFIKNSDTGQLKPIALLGLEQFENLYYSIESWSAPYIPSTLRIYPFGIAQTHDGSILCVDTSSQNISTTDGEPLFLADGQDSEKLKEIKGLITEYASQSAVTDQFIKHLTALALLEPMTYSVNEDETDNAPYSISGIYIVNKIKLNELSDDQYLELKKKGYLPAIYAHLMSINLISILATKKASTHTKP